MQPITKHYIKQLANQQIITPPTWLIDNTFFWTLGGSHLYNTATEQSDIDIYGVCVPPENIIFPEKYGYIYGFSKDIPIFSQYSQNFVFLKIQHDITVFNIVKFFRLAADGNPNIIDLLFVDKPIHSTPIWDNIIEHRNLFLHKGLYHRFVGYAKSQLNNLTKQKYGKRKATIEKYGYDTKDAYHLVRLIFECRQLLKYGTMSYDNNGNELLLAIRCGVVPHNMIITWANEQFSLLENDLEKSKLPNKPDEQRILQLLRQCLNDWGYK